MTVAFAALISTEILRPNDEQTAKRHLGQKRQSFER